MKTINWILRSGLILLFVLPAMTVNAAGPRSAAISLGTPTPNPGVIGGDVTLDLVFTVANIEPGVAGADVYVSYNPAFVAPPTSPNTPVVEVRPDFFGTSNVSLNEVLPAAQCPGTASPCVHIVLAGPAQVTKTGAAVRFHFRGVAEGQACFSVLQSTLADADGFPVTHTPATNQCVPIVYRVTVNSTVLRQGVPANPNPGGGSLACSTVTTTGAITLGPIYTDVNGKFSVTNLPIGTTTIRAAYPGYLPSEKAIVVAAGGASTVDVAATTLRGGDVNGDNAINILDIGAIIAKFGQTGVAIKSPSANCAGADEPADVNDDGLVNISDLAITAGNWGRTGPTLWP
jgi:hypothetical protein